MPAARRLALVQAAAVAGLPIVEDNPYGDLWYDQPPPPPLAAMAEDDSVLYLGSFSKVLAPGLRLGYMVAPTALFPKLLQAKQAADLHTPGFNQRVVHEVIKGGFLREHAPTIRSRYKTHRDAMQKALAQHLAEHCRWVEPAGGMFYWLELPPQVDAELLLPKAVEAGMAFVPGAAFYPGQPRHNTLRLSFVTVPPPQIEAGVALLAGVLQDMLKDARA